MIPLKDDIPTTRPPVLTVALIVINVLVYIYQFMQGPNEPQIVAQFGLVPYELTHGVTAGSEAHIPATMTIFTSMFLHGSWMHLGGNMLYLWIFGNNIEDRFGPLPFLGFYLLSGVAAAMLFVVTAPSSNIPLVGASGAIAGVLGAYAVGFPRARILTLIFLGWFIRLIWIPAFVVLGFWFVLQLLYSLPSLGQASTGGVAYMAHVGGFAFGLLVAILFRSRFY